jgi:hypothetical protein
MRSRCRRSSLGSPLGSPPPTHARAARECLRHARQQLDAAERALTQGDCRRAFAELVAGAICAGMAWSHASVVAALEQRSPIADAVTRGLERVVRLRLEIEARCIR